MPRPPSDRVEEGFHIWSTEAERNDTRTAKRMGIPQRTVSYWKRAYGWNERYLSLRQPDGKLFANLARHSMRAYLPEGVESLIQIVSAERPLTDRHGQAILDDEGRPIMVPVANPRDFAYMMKLLLQFGLKGTSGTVSGEPSAVSSHTKTANPNDARDQASAVVKAMANVPNSRGKKRQRV